MMKKQMQAIRWVMTLATILVLALLAWQCVDIYLEGNLYSAWKLWKHVCGPFCLCWRFMD